MASGEPTLDPSLTIAFGTSEALNLALASIRAAMVVINGNPGPAIDYFALLQAAADIIEYRRDIMDEVETALQCPQNPVDLQDGYQAANAWYVDLKARISDIEQSKGVSGYTVDSRLREAFENLKPSQRTTFLDAVGAYVMIFKTVGGPSATNPMTEERLRFYCLSPAEQDAYAARAPEKELSHV